MLSVCVCVCVTVQIYYVGIVTFPNTQTPDIHHCNWHSTLQVTIIRHLWRILTVKMALMSYQNHFSFTKQYKAPWVFICLVSAVALCQVTTLPLQGGADKSLAPLTSRCRRTELIVSLERGVCSCAELQVFPCYRGWKEACQARRAISTTSRRELSSRFFFLQGKALKEIHAIMIVTLWEHAWLHATVKNRVVLFKRGDFSTCVAPRPQNSDHPRRVLIRFTN